MSILDFIAPGSAKRNQAMTSTQTHLRIAEIRDNTLVLKNGGIRAVLKTSSINFNLKSEQEQNAIIHAYQGFLNSLEFPVQIIVRSKKLDIDNYIEQVKKIGEKQQNKLLQEQTFEYAAYVKRLVEYADIMEKEFYVVVPQDPGRILGHNAFQSFFQRLAPSDSYNDIKRRQNEFEQLRKSLTQKVSTVKTGLENCSLKVEELNTLEIIELFYKSYNPKTSHNQKLKDLKETALEFDESPSPEKAQK